MRNEPLRITNFQSVNWANLTAEISFTQIFRCYIVDERDIVAMRNFCTNLEKINSLINYFIRQFRVLRFTIRPLYLLVPHRVPALTGFTLTRIPKTAVPSFCAQTAL